MIVKTKTIFIVILIVSAYDKFPETPNKRINMAIRINKPLAGGTGSITTGVLSSGTGSAVASQASDIDNLLAAFEAAGIVSASRKFSKPDTPKMTNRHLYSIDTPRKEAIDHVIDVLNLLDNVKVVGS